MFIGRAVDGHPMIAAENDRRLLQRTHRDGSGSQVPNREEISIVTLAYCMQSRSDSDTLTCVISLTRSPASAGIANRPLVHE